jgi:hypothetical protein
VIADGAGRDDSNTALRPRGASIRQTSSAEFDVVPAVDHVDGLSTLTDNALPTVYD